MPHVDEAPRPKIAIQIPDDPGNGDDGRRRDINSFTLTADVRSLWDPFNFTIPNPDGKFTYMLRYELFPLQIWHSDPYVQNGVERIWYRGVITKTGQKVTDQGRVITFSGYDAGWYLSSHAPYHVRIRGAQIPDLCKKLIDPSWGVKYVFEGNFGKQLKQGRVDAETRKYLSEAKAASEAQAAQIAAATPPGARAPSRQEVATSIFARFKAMIPVIQTMPGETVADVLARYARLQGALMNMHPDGNLCFFKPNYDKPADYVFHCHEAGHPQAHLTNVYQPDYQRDGEAIVNDVSCIGTRIVGLTMPNTADPNEGKFVGRYINRNIAGPTALPGGAAGPVQTLSASPLRRHAFMDPDRLDKRQAAARARWRFDQGVYERETLTYIHQGHSQRRPDGTAIPFVENSMAEVHDSLADVNGLWYVARVMPVLPLDGGAYTVITLKPPRLLAA